MPIEQTIGLLILVLASMAAGWFLAHRSTRKGGRQRGGFQRPEYFKGLNYLVNEQPDKAIEVFLRMVELDSETVETHFALAALFRRRGEVDRAIRLHQNLVARPNLPRASRNHALRELGEDYMKAGLLDRAEALFKDLNKIGSQRELALRHLVSIYEQQKDWNEAIATLRLYDRVSDDDQSRVVAHYYCELAHLRQQDNDWRGALKHLKHAQNFDRNSIRVAMMLGNTAANDGKLMLALRQFRRALEADVVFAGEILPRVAAIYKRLERSDGLDEMIEILSMDNARAATEFALAAIRNPALATPAAQRCIDQYIQRSSSMTALRDIVLAGSSAPHDEQGLSIFEQALGRLMREGAAYRCHQCGYKGNTLYWLCPSCRHWGTTKPYADFKLSGPTN